MKFVHAVALAIALSLPSTLSAALVTTAFPSPTATADFSQFTGGGEVNGSSGPVNIGTFAGNTITWTATNNDGYLYNSSWGISTNGSWDSGRNGFSGLNASVGSTTFTFSAPVASVGAFINYSPADAPNTMTIAALDQLGNVIESHNIPTEAPITTPAATNAGAFRGITRPTAEIWGFRLTNQYLVTDDLAFVATATAPAAEVPALSPMALGALALALAGVGLIVKMG